MESFFNYYFEIDISTAEFEIMFNMLCHGYTYRLFIYQVGICMCCMLTCLSNLD